VLEGIAEGYNSLKDRINSKKYSQMNNKKGYINLGGSNQNSAVRPEAAVTGSKKHGINWNEGPARAKSTGNPQGQWAESDLNFAAKWQIL